MVETYQISTQGVMDGYCKEQVAELLMILFKRSKEEIQPILDSKGYVLKRGMNLASALKYKGTLEQRGCKCSVEQLKGADKLAPDFPDTVMVQINTDWTFVPDISGSFAVGSPPEAKPVAPVLTSADLETRENTVQNAPVLTNEIGITVKGNPFFVQTPQEMCCNCATRSTVSPIETPFVKNLVFSSRFEGEHQFQLDLPYCPTCAESIGKYPMRSALKWLIGCCIWFLVFMWLALTFNLPQKPLLIKLLILTVPLIPAILAIHWTGKPKAPMTSKYTPVMIKEYSRNSDATRPEGRAMLLVWGWLVKKFGKPDQDKIRQLSMKFSNPDYRRAFRKANRTFIKSGYLKIL